jgi:hypothetical protein
MSNMETKQDNPSDPIHDPEPAVPAAKEESNENTASEATPNQDTRAEDFSNVVCNSAKKDVEVLVAMKQARNLGRGPERRSKNCGVTRRRMPLRRESPL